jgi:uncharacterized protein (TIGR02646 family)
MIHLTKADEPTVLQENAMLWTEVILDKLASGEEPTAAEKSRYRHPQVKAQLIAETGGKCAYCESKLLHVHHGDVEHIYPKSLDPLRTFEWENLTLACEVCNQSKSNNDPLLKHIIDPYAVDPEQHLTFLGPLIVSRGTMLGNCTREMLKLTRAGLNEQRQRQVERLLLIFDRLHDDRLPVPARQAIYADLIATETAPTAQYAAMNRAIVRQLSLALPAGLQV